MTLQIDLFIPFIQFMESNLPERSLGDIIPYNIVTFQIKELNALL